MRLNILVVTICMILCIFAFSSFNSDSIDGLKMSEVVEAGSNDTPPLLLELRVLDASGRELPQFNGTYFMSGNATDVMIKCNARAECGILFWSEALYINSTMVSHGSYSWSSPCYNWSRSYNLQYSVLGVNALLINLTVTTDSFASSLYRMVIRDVVPPSRPTFESIRTICGGLIIKGLNAIDNLRVSSYAVYINGSMLTPPVTVEDLYSSTLTPKIDPEWVACQGILVLNLTKYADEWINITIAAIDLAGNIGEKAHVGLIHVPNGLWIPIEVHQGWNLIGISILPKNSSTEAILSLFIKHGPIGKKVIYGFDNLKKEWLINPAVMEFCHGYWIYSENYDVLILEGYWPPPPPSPPPTIHLYKGWNLICYAGAKPSPPKPCCYFQSLTPGSYFKFVYEWDAKVQAWTVIDTGQPYTFKPGQALWIYVYEDEILVPPIN